MTSAGPDDRIPSGRHVHHGAAPDAEVATRRRRAVLAGHHGDPAGARALLSDPEPVVRAAALGALHRMAGDQTTDGLRDPELANGLTDPDPAVRRRALEVLAGRDPASDAHREALVALLADGDRSVVEVACWAAGEHPEWSNHTVGPLSVVAGTSKPADGHDDSLCREAAVAALGAVGHAGGRASVLAGLSDRPTVRRRAVLALASFEGDDVEAALRSALNDRDWQVRQAAEDLLGVEPEGSPTGDS